MLMYSISNVNRYSGCNYTTENNDSIRLNEIVSIVARQQGLFTGNMDSCLLCERTMNTKKREMRKKNIEKEIIKCYTE